MHSSISSSSDRAPALAWKRIALFSGLSIATLLVGAEILFRAMGHVPAIVDDVDLWCITRDRIDNTEKTPVAILGASRIQFGFDIKTWEQHFPNHEVCQLAVSGASPVATLHDLAEVEHFKGIVILSMAPYHLRPERINEQASYVRDYHRNWTPTQKMDRQARSMIQQNVVIMNPQLSWNTQLQWLSKGKMVPRDYITRTLSRQWLGDYHTAELPAIAAARLAGGKKLYQNAIADPFHPEAWLDQVKLIQASIARLQARGTQVIFVQYPTTGRYRESLDAAYPREQYWDALEANITASCIHFSDYPALTTFDCPDGSHLDYRDVPAFTQALIDIITEEKLLKPE